MKLVRSSSVDFLYIVEKKVFLAIHHGLLNGINHFAL